MEPPITEELPTALKLLAGATNSPSTEIEQQ